LHYLFRLGHATNASHKGNDRIGEPVSMNYPVWEVAFGGGLLVAIVSVLHVFVSHFAVGGGLFLVVTQARAMRRGDDRLLAWLKRHTRFFVLVTVVFGAVSGVGIWFTIGLVNPSGTSALIHLFVWGWAIEWVFFFVEITAAILYLYGWDRIDRRTHLWIGWIYFVAAYLSLVVINGIITFMLTPGRWLETGGFWDGFFNPTYLPSLAFRTGIAAALAGVYALVTAAVQKDRDLKATVVRWSGRWILPGLVVAALSGLWYVSAVPDSVWANAQGRMPTATRHAEYILYTTALMFVLVAAALVAPRRLNLAWSLLVLLAALATLGSFEFVREAIRKPFVIHDYLYANAIYARPVAGDGGLNPEALDRDGVLKRARFVRHREITEANRIAAGREIFTLQCHACHSLTGYRGVGRPIVAKQWGYPTLVRRIGTLQKMYNGVMPPFAGTRAEREALAAFLADRFPVEEKKSARPVAPGPGAPVPPAKIDAGAVWARYCSECHEREIDDAAFEGVKGKTVSAISDVLSRLNEINENMDPFPGSAAEREALARWLAAERRRLEEEEGE